MASRRVPSSSNRNTLSIAVMAVGALLLLIVPLLMFVLSLGHTANFHLPGTLLILSVTAGMACVVMGAALHD
ncbi:MAG: hypothetical protein ABI670_07895 [Chloroflexota bacterium]